MIGVGPPWDPYNPAFGWEIILLADSIIKY